MRGEDWGGGEGNISTSTAWRPLSLELFQLSPLTSRQIVIAWCASGRIEYGERQNVVKEEFHFESATQPFELTDEIATIVFNRLFTFVIKNKLERERERGREPSSRRRRRHRQSSGEWMTPLAVDPVGAETQVWRYLVEKRMFQRFRQRDPLRRLVVEHALDDVKEEDVIFFVRHLIAFQGLAVFADVAARRALLVPV